MKNKLKNFRKYNNDTTLTPVWKGEVVYNESVMFLENADGSFDAAPLLYTPKNIISVRDSSLAKEYIPGVDYLISDGRLKRTKGSSMPYMQRDFYYPPEPIEGITFGCSLGGYIRYAPGDEMFTRQVFVTYTHSDGWRGYKPEFQGDRLPRTMQALRENKPFSIAFNGDSIMVGANSSGWSGINVPPYAPIWVDTFMEKLRRNYGLTDFTYSNTAVGGMQSGWGLENVEELVNKYQPDLAVIGFGMNDGYATAEQFTANIKGIMDAVRAKNPECEFILIATTLPNAEAAGFFVNQPLFERALIELARNYGGAAVCNMTAMHSRLLARKRFYDMTGNNINHPNDFLAAVYAQSLAQMVIEELN